MKGDRIIIGDDMRRVARVIADHLLPDVLARTGRSVVAVAGESGSGKSAAARALAEAFDERDAPATVFGQDDYFALPPRTNDAERRRDLSWVGPQEVRLDLLDAHLRAARESAATLERPLVDYAADRIGTEVVSLDGIRVLIAEGTYTMLLANVDTRVFIARTWLDTAEDRRQRGREAPDPFLDEVLAIEHRIIGASGARADIVVTREFEVVLDARSQAT